MKLRAFTRTLLASAVALAAGQALAAPNLVTNGNFEATGVGQIDSVISGTGWTNSTVFNGFNNVSAFNFIVDTTADDALSGTSGGFPSENSGTLHTNIFVHGPGNGTNNGFTGSSNGGKFLGGDGGYATGPVSQTINGLTVGHDYTLSFEWAGTQFTDQSGAYWVGWDGTFGSDTFSVGGPGTSVASHGFKPWESASFTFTATSASQVLSFLATGPSGLPPFSLLDGVSLVDVTIVPPPPVPEPESIALMLAGGALLAGAKRRRDAKRA